MRTIPSPPPGVVVTDIPSLDVHQAVTWCMAELQFPVTARWLKECTNRGELQCALVAGRRRYSTASLLDFAVSLPNRKNSRKRDAS